MANVRLPSAAREFTGGDVSFEVDGRTVAELIAVLNREYPGLESLLGDEGGLRPGIAVAVDGVIRGREVYRPLEPGSEVCFMSAIYSG